MKMNLCLSVISRLNDFMLILPILALFFTQIPAVSIAEEGQQEPVVASASAITARTKPLASEAGNGVEVSGIAPKPLSGDQGIHVTSTQTLIQGDNPLSKPEVVVKHAVAKVVSPQIKLNSNPTVNPMTPKPPLGIAQSVAPREIGKPQNHPAQGMLSKQEGLPTNLLNEFVRFFKLYGNLLSHKYPDENQMDSK